MKSRIFYLAGAFVVLALLAPLGACMPDGKVVYFAAPGGSSGSGPVSCGGSSGTSDLATWANVRDVISPEQTGGCAGADCHIQGDRQPYLFGLNATPLSDDDLYTKLTTYTTTKCGQRKLVNPCAPDESAFYLAQAHLCGADLVQMPSGCAPEYDNCTPDDKLEGIRQWIAKGAPRP